MNFTSGAYGDPSDPRTRVAFWAEMEELHYPLASRAKAQAEQQVEEMMQQQAMMAAQQQAVQMAAAQAAVMPQNIGIMPTAGA